MDETTGTGTAVEEIMALDRAALTALWRAGQGASPPPSISQPLMRRILAFEHQLQAAGGWPPALRQRIARGMDHRPRVRAAAPKPGGRLLREWNGTTHVVEIDAEGYRWNGRNWSSLSAIAREITGAHWSGPRFFGLKPGDPRARTLAKVCGGQGQRHEPTHRPLRHLHPQVDRRRARAGLQLARCPARSLCCLYREPATRGLAGGEGAL